MRSFLIKIKVITFSSDFGPVLLKTSFKPFWIFSWIKFSYLDFSKQSNIRDRWFLLYHVCNSIFWNFILGKNTFGVP